MSIDSLFIVVLPRGVSAEELAHANLALHRSPFASELLSGKSLDIVGNRLRMRDVRVPPCGVVLDLDLLLCYFGPGYERGHWPTILEIGTWLSERFPDAELRYGTDNTDDPTELWDAALQERNAALWSAQEARRVRRIRELAGRVRTLASREGDPT